MDYRQRTIIYRQVHCLWCGAELEHKATGRAREFCSTKCRVYYGRAVKRYAKRCVNAALARRSEPARDFGYPVEIRQYIVSDDGAVTRREYVTERI